MRRHPRLVPLLVVLSLLACGGRGSDAPLEVTLEEERGVAFVDPKELHAFMEAGHEDEVVFVDNRNAFAYSQSRIAGARLMSTDEVQRSVGNLPLNKWVVMYCT